MTVVFPYLEKLQKEGELGRKKITQYTRYLTVVLSILQSMTIAFTLQRTAQNGQSLVYHPGVAFTLMTVLTLTTGSAFIMWLGEQISERGVGNGMSLIIFVEGGQRRIPVQYAKRVVGRRVMGGQMTYLPLRVNSGGVIPPIFASSLLTFPGTLALMFSSKYKFLQDLSNTLKWGEPLYTLIYVSLIILFAFFYVGIVFNPTELADNMRKNGGFIPGIRPGRNTSEHINR